jgi:hypothetical protein
MRRGIRATIPPYRYALDKVRRGIRATIPPYRYALDKVRRGIPTAIPVYRYLLDGMRRGVQATISFTSFRYGIIGVAALGVLAPLCLVLYQSFLTAPFLNSTARLGLEAYQFVFADEDFRVAIGTTLLLAASMTMIAVPLGAVLAFLMMRTDVPGRHWLEPLILLPIFLPALVLAFGRRSARTGRHPDHDFQRMDRSSPVERLFIPFSGHDCRPHPCAACLSLCRCGFARSRR